MASIEPLVADWASEQISQLGWDRRGPEQISVNTQIDNSLKSNPSKQGGAGGGRPDYTIIISNGNQTVPVIIEYKGTKNKLERLSKQDIVIFRDAKGDFDYDKTISKFAVNGAAYYARNIVKDTTFHEVLIVGVNGYKDTGNDIHYEVKVYLTTVENPELPYLVGTYSDLSFLHKTQMEILFNSMADAKLDPKVLHDKQIEDDSRLDKVLKDLNQFLHDGAKIPVSKRIAIVTASIMAGLGVQEADGTYKVVPLQPAELMGSNERENTDGDKILNKVKNFLGDHSRTIPQEKQDTIINSLRQTLIFSNLQIKNADSNMSPIAAAYTKVYEKLIPAYKTTESMDFTGKLFNVLNDWVKVPDGDKNDIVLTPRFVTDVMARLAGVNMNSYVWDWALGSGGFLISAMNQMLKDAKRRIDSPIDLRNREQRIKSQQLLGVEYSSDIYILAVLNMILMGDGSSNILNVDSLTEFDGNYAYGTHEKFPADVFLLNPPYSAPGKGMIFVEKALEKMDHGKAAIIIQDSAGSGQATEYNKRLLKNNRLLASIKMPGDLFKASVQTSIYLFEIGVPQQPDDIVKFVDFREDGFKRSNRKKASTNLIDTGTAHARYDELVTIIKNGAKNADFYKEGDLYFEDTIDPSSGNDWNLEDHQKRDVRPTLNDFETVVGSYISWEIGEMLNKGEEHGELS